MASGPESVASTDIDGDQFEDAQDASSPVEKTKPPRIISTRSLTGEQPPLPSSDASPKFSESTEADSSSHESPKSEDEGSVGTKATTENEEPKEAAEADRPPSKSPRHIPVLSTGTLDEVNLEGQREDSKASIPNSPESPPKDRELSPPPPPPPPKSRFGGLGSLSSIHWSPSQLAKKEDSPTSTPAPKKRPGPFAWLSRSSSKDLSSPSVQASGSSPRRNTTSSVATNSNNPELMLSRLDEVPENGNLSNGKTNVRNSLRDRFKMLRLREEAGITSLDGDESAKAEEPGSVIAGLVGRAASIGTGVATPAGLAEDKDNALVASPKDISSPHSLPATVNPNLPPGTAAGVAVGPSTGESAVPVDWDLWQEVVYEGPAAVARSSPEELKHAIASGIPSAIRGVVWQVLAQSKNEELEQVYHDLVARGTDHERQRLSTSSGGTIVNGHVNGSMKEKESVTSSSSSVRSDHSAPTSNSGTSPTPPHEKDQATLMAEKKKKAKEDAAALRRLEKTIRRDLGARTSYSKFAIAAGLQEGLFGVCKAYALFDEEVGYAQGMNFLAMPILFNMPEEEAFCLLVRLMNHYHMRDMFIRDMPGLHLHLYQFERLLEDFEPALYCHLHRRGVNPQLYATQWFLTLFAYRFPLQLVLRVYDLLLSEGLEGAILKFGIVLMQKNAQTLLGMNDMSQLTTFLKEKIFDVYIDKAPSANSILESGFFGSSGGVDKEIYRADMLVQDACAVKITPETLKTYALEWEEKTRTEKERETELLTLKAQNHNLLQQVRTLEERAEKSDQEHVQMASELVRIKVHNEELMDQNESMKGQVVELRKLVDRQPEEIENRMKAEMDQVMKRNLEVQDQNRALEDQMAEMERDLVEAKMQWAEINSSHEDLKRKWNDLRKALDT